MTSVEMRESNIKAHLDIEDDLNKQQEGLVTFSLRINNGNIVDYNKTEYVNSKKYFNSSLTAEFQLSVKRDAKAQSSLPHDHGERD